MASASDAAARHAVRGGRDPRTGTGEIVLISQDGVAWDLPGGRPEGDETWEETLRRELLEEACAAVVQARLLGFFRGECVRGHQAGRTIVRSVWRADVEPGPWEPRFEITHRRLVPVSEVLAVLTIDDGYARTSAGRWLRPA